MMSGETNEIATSSPPFPLLFPVDKAGEAKEKAGEAHESLAETIKEKLQ